MGACLACAEHPCKQECLRQLSVWQHNAASRGEPVPSDQLCDGALIIESKSCAECETVLRTIADFQEWVVVPVCDGVTEAS